MVFILKGYFFISECNFDFFYTLSTDVKFYTNHDSTYAYFCIITLHDSTSGGIGDIGRFMWDTSHNALTSPQTDDKLYECRSDGTNADYAEGTGAIWDYTVTLPSGATIDADLDSGEGYIVYETRMPLTALNANNNFDEDGEIIGFAVYTFDVSDSSAGEWPDDASHTNPSTWGDLYYESSEIPEFSVLLMPVAFVITLLLIFRSQPPHKKRNNRNIKGVKN